MASSEGVQKKKRAWRKPREAIGPGVLETSSETKPKLARIGHTEEPTQKKSHGGETMDSAESQTCGSSGEKEGSSDDTRNWNETEQGRLEQRHDKGGGASVSASLTSQPPVAALVEIDGSVLEGGGQILRNAMALSCILQQPIHITQIRAGRTNPGLYPQHLTGIQLLSEVCGGRLEGDYPGSSEVTFHPQPIVGGTFTADTKTAGSVCLLLQAALPSLLFAPRPSTVILKGGTNADMAPPIDYTLKVFQPIAAKFGVHFDCQLKRRGFYPKGRGEVIVSPTPLKELTPVTITDPGHLTSIKIHAFVAGAVRPQVSHQMVQSARHVLERQLSGVPIKVHEVQETPQSAFGNSSGIIIIAESSTGCLYAGSANGRKNETSDKTARAAADELIRNVQAGGCVDEHLQDQLIILMMLAKGRSVIRTGPVTLHTQTAIHVAELMTKAKFTVEKVEGKGEQEVNLITCEGIGFTNERLT